MASIGSLIVNISANTVSLEQGVSKSKGLIGDLNTAMGSIGLGTIGAAAVIGGVSKFLGDAVTMAQEAEGIQSDLLATIESTGGIAGITADEVNTIAEKLSGVTRYEDDIIVKADAMLLTFTNIGKDIIPDVTLSILDMAEKFGSVEAATLQVGKALNDPIAGVGALRRVGVQLSDEQEAQVKKFMQNGDLQAAQMVILTELQKEFGGQAVAAGQTSAGQMDILNNRLGNTQEAIGTGLIPIVGDLTTAFTGLLTPLTGSNDQLSAIVETVGRFEMGPMLTALETGAWLMSQVNQVGAILNGVLEKIGLGGDKAGKGIFQMDAMMKSAFWPITLFTQGPLAAFRDVIAGINEALSRIKQLWDMGIGGILDGFKTDFARLGIPGFAEGGVVPGPTGAPVLAVVHGGETITPAGGARGASVTISGGINFYGTPAPANSQEANRSADLFLGALRARGVAI